MASETCSKGESGAVTCQESLDLPLCFSEKSCISADLLNVVPRRLQTRGLLDILRRLSQFMTFQSYLK